MRKEGFNIGAKRSQPKGFIWVENSGHGGAGVAASWACASKAVEAFRTELGEAAGSQCWG